MDFELAPRSDIAALRARFHQEQCVSIDNFLPEEQARALHAELEASSDWIQIFRAGDKVFEMPDEAFRALAPDKLATLDTLVMEEARKMLQYRYRSIRVSDRDEERGARGLLLDRFALFLASEPCLRLLRDVTGRAQIARIDAQGTSFRAGSFLTSHDDAVEGKKRLAAYVFGLTRHWQADWGGLLLLEQGSEVRGFVPDFNALRIFRVPQPHHVSIVSPWVDAERISVTGWLREAD